MRGLAKGHVVCSVLALFGCVRPAAAQMTLTYRSQAAIGSSAVDQHGTMFAVTGMSGVTYLGGGEYLAVMDNSDKLVRLHVALNADGSIASAGAMGGVTLAENSDHEGIALSGAGTVFVSNEVEPAIAEFDLASGSVVRSLAVPPVFANIRANFGFESLTRRGNTGEVWTANEEAMTVDGAVSSQAAGTTVRLLRYAAPVALGGAPTPAQQFAYVTQPWHGSSITGARSGVSDMVALPTGEVLVLERSLALGAGFFQNRIYLVTFAGATDVSSLAGLSGQVYTPAAKQLLWSAYLNQNLEGLCLGPRLGGAGSGHWALLGVVDDADPISTNVVVSFDLYRPGSCAGDFSGDGVLSVQDIFDYLNAWFAGNPLADLNDDGLAVQDVFDFLNAWFAGC